MSYRGMNFTGLPGQQPPQAPEMPMTPEEMAQKQRMMGGMAHAAVKKPPKNIGEGLNALGRAFAYRGMASDVDAAQQAGVQAFNPRFEAAMQKFGGLGGLGGFGGFGGFGR